MLDNEEALQDEYIDFCSCNYDTDDTLKIQEEKQQKKNNDKYELEEVVTLTTVPHLAKDQSTGEGDVAKIYRAIRDKTEIPDKEVHSGSIELRQLNKMRHSMRISTEGLLKLRVVENDREKWRLICPNIMRKKVIWTTHRLAHSGANRTLNRIKLI